MLELYTWTTPNGRKVAVMLEELGLPYRVHPVDLGAGAQFEADFLAIAPNGRIPAIVDDGVAIMESGAILVHLAERHDRFLPAAGAGRAEALQWLFWQMANLGPMLGQLNHFVNAAPEPIPHAIDRYLKESLRLLTVMDDRLRGRDYLAGEYGVADIAAYPWVEAAWAPLKSMAPDRIGVLDALDGWLRSIARRPAVAEGMQIGARALTRPGLT